MIPVQEILSLLINFKYALTFSTNNPSPRLFPTNTPTHLYTFKCTCTNDIYTNITQALFEQTKTGNDPSDQQ